MSGRTTTSTPATQCTVCHEDRWPIDPPEPYVCKRCEFNREKGRSR